MRLADFILFSMEPILLEWEVFARSITPGAKMDALALRNHANAILLATVHDMNSSQTRSERVAKSRGNHPDRQAGELNGASDRHAIGRLGSGFDLMDVVSEYRALRASVLRLWRDSAPAADDRDVDDLTRFNESIDQSLVKAVSSYTRRVDQSRDLFLAILGHDLRNPLNSIAMSAALLPASTESRDEAIHTASQISISVSLMGRMISDLLDYTRTRLGAGMPVSPVPADLAILTRAVYEEYRAGFPERDIRFESQAELNGQWDPDRIRQTISNLVGNAIQHGDPSAPVLLRLSADSSHVVITVHNGGPPIDPGEKSKIFEPMIRGSSAGRPPHNRLGSIGLGLYIAREIARSHGGDILVTSTLEAGTTFTVHLPRHAHTTSAPPILDEEHLASM